MADPKKKAYKEALEKFREKYFKELERSIKVAIDIRDDEEAGAKNQIEAIKVISRMLQALQPDRTISSKQSITKPTEKPEATNKELEELDKIINAP